MRINTSTIKIKKQHKETKTIPVICPWCNMIFRLSEWEIEQDTKTGATHGICPNCLKNMMDKVPPKKHTVESYPDDSDSE